uniref:Starch synthase catalytic domain-containing protein n=1 Tax=Nelumbo nucifera TaxID=4432 RepID=A0A822Y8W9_NELNU|nr:TPA_asm: hypothetical protein HUJ06_030325 [Nelumbo nucifera]
MSGRCDAYWKHSSPTRKGVLWESPTQTVAVRTGQRHPTNNRSLPLRPQLFPKDQHAEDETVKSPPLAEDNVTNIILVPTECAPLLKTGGLGDVAGTLLKALARRGHRVMVVAPRHGNYTKAQETGVRKSPMFRNIEENIYGEGREDVLKRMVLFGKAALEVPFCKYTQGVPVIHNIAHRGRGPVHDFCYVDLPQNYFKLYDPGGGEHFNVLAAGLSAAARVVTVSHGYA